MGIDVIDISPVHAAVQLSSPDWPVSASRAARYINDRLAQAVKDPPRAACGHRPGLPLQDTDRAISELGALHWASWGCGGLEIGANDRTEELSVRTGSIRSGPVEELERADPACTRPSFAATGWAITT